MIAKTIANHIFNCSQSDVGLDLEFLLRCNSTMSIAKVKSGELRYILSWTFFEESPSVVYSVDISETYIDGIQQASEKLNFLGYIDKDFTWDEFENLYTVNLLDFLLKTYFDVDMDEINLVYPCASPTDTTSSLPISLNLFSSPDWDFIQRKLLFWGNSCAAGKISSPTLCINTFNAHILFEDFDLTRNWVKKLKQKERESVKIW